MANSLVASQNGTFFQESLFWLHGAKMLGTNSVIEAVGWEVDDVIGFDDVIVDYKPNKKTDRITGEVIDRDCIQAKHHVDKSKFFSVAALTDPAFIGASSVSLLQKLYKQQQSQTGKKTNVRYILINTWGLDASDPIGDLIGTGGIIRLEVLFDNTTDASKMGKVRKLWREHLGLASDAELKHVIKQLRIRTDYKDLYTIGETLNPHLELAGLAPLPEDGLANKYYGLIPMLHGQKKNWFDANQLRELCRAEGLMLAVVTDDAYGIGIRTFMQGAENLANETQELLCLSHLYDGRQIKDHKEWSEQVFPAIKTFLAGILSKQDKILFSLDTHLSLAFAVGYCVDPKMGKHVAVLQKTKNSKIRWEPKFDSEYQEADLFNWKEITHNNSATDIVVAVSVTHDTEMDVDAFVKKELSQVSRILHARIHPEPSFQAIKDGTHVLSFAQALAQRIIRSRSATERNGRVHIFIAAPVAAAFFLGQYAKALGQLTLYEFNFSAPGVGAYQAVLTFPN